MYNVSLIYMYLLSSLRSLFTTIANLFFLLISHVEHINMTNVTDGRGPFKLPTAQLPSYF